MKKITAAIASLLFIVPALVWANTPPPRKTLAERVELATHVVIGTAKNVRVVEGITNEKQETEIQEVKPEPAIIAPREYAEIEIEVEEVRYPAEWKAPKTVKYMFGGGWFEMKSIRDDTLDKKRIYLMQANPYPELKNAEHIFFPSYEWNLCDTVDNRAEIVALLQERVKREQENPDKGE